MEVNYKPRRASRSRPQIPTPMKTPCFRLLCKLASIIGALAVAALAQTSGGTISGSVSNAGTGDLLEGVRVTLPNLGLTVLTDHTGRYVFPDVPAGAQQIVATYTGLDLLKHEVTV